jgi:RimK-like ATP-grasp domain
MKQIAVFFEHPGVLDYPFDSARYLNSHRELGAEIEALGCEYRIVRHLDTYDGNGRFARSWRFQDGCVVDNGPLQADVVFDKGCFTPDDFDPVFNCRPVNRICTDKWETYGIFEAQSPFSILIQSKADLADALARIPTDFKVIKPVSGLQGEGVRIGTPDDLMENGIDMPVIVQEFLDSSGGISGIVEGVHDFRITLLNGEVICALVRKPPPGQLVAAISRGATMSVVERSTVPQSLLDMAMLVDRQFEDYGQRLYSVDMAMTPDGPRIIELNSRVALRENKTHPDFQRLKQLLARVLVSLATDG